MLKMTLSSEILLRNSSSLEDSMVGSAAQEDIQVPSKILMLDLSLRIALVVVLGYSLHD
jgi:hypothetical protein